MTPRIQTLFLYAALSVLTIAAYYPSVEFDFVNYDDNKYVSANPHIPQGLTLKGIAYAWTTFDLGNWIPLTWLSYLLDATLFGMKPAGFHATNVAWHVANVCLIFYVLQRMTGCMGRSALVAAFFAIHPLHIQSVAWISERKDVLSTFWLLIALAVYERYAARKTFGLYAGVFTAMALGLMAKSMLVTLPLLMLLLDFWPLNRWAGGTPALERYPQTSLRALLLEKVPLLALAFADGVLTMIAQESADAMAGLRMLGGWHRYGNAVRSIGWYLWKTVWPVNLCPFYPHPRESLAWEPVWLSLGVIVAISIWVGWNWRKNRYLVTGWLWFLIALLPVLGFVQVGGHAQADRYAYVPHLGLFVLIVWSAADLAERGFAARWLIPALALAAVAGGFVLMRQELAPWKNSVTLWEHALLVEEENYVAHQLLGIALADQRRLDDAETHFHKALALNPGHIEFLCLGKLHLDRFEWDDAFFYLEWAKRLAPKDPQVQKVWLDAVRRGGNQRTPRPVSQYEPVAAAKQELDLGQAQFSTGDLPAARRHFLAALERDPKYPEAHNCLGIVLNNQGETDQAVAHFQQAIAADPKNPDAYFNLADLYEHQSRWKDAQALFEEVLKLAPKDPEARFRLNQIKRRILSGKPK